MTTNILPPHPNGNHQNIHIDFVGTYSLQGSNYYQNNTTNLLVKLCERKQPNALKPSFYLLTRNEQGKFNYLTSLYPRHGIFVAEIKQRYFIVELKKELMTISAK